MTGTGRVARTPRTTELDLQDLLKDAAAVGPDELQPGRVRGVPDNVNRHGWTWSQLQPLPPRAADEARLRLLTG